MQAERYDGTAARDGRPGGPPRADPSSSRAVFRLFRAILFVLRTVWWTILSPVAVAFVTVTLYRLPKALRAITRGHAAATSAKRKGSPWWRRVGPVFATQLYNVLADVVALLAGIICMCLMYRIGWRSEDEKSLAAKKHSQALHETRRAAGPRESVSNTNGELKLSYQGENATERQRRYSLDGAAASPPEETVTWRTLVFAKLQEYVKDSFFVILLMLLTASVVGAVWLIARRRQRGRWAGANKSLRAWTFLAITSPVRNSVRALTETFTAGHRGEVGAICSILFVHIVSGDATGKICVWSADKNSQLSATVLPGRRKRGVTAVRQTDDSGEAQGNRLDPAHTRGPRRPLTLCSAMLRYNDSHISTAIAGTSAGEVIVFPVSAAGRIAALPILWLHRDGAAITELFSLGQERIVSGSKAGTLRVWDIAGCADERKDSHSLGVAARAAILMHSRRDGRPISARSACGTSFAVCHAGHQGVTFLHSLERLKVSVTEHGTRADVRAVAAHGDRAYVGEIDGTIEVFDVLGEDVVPAQPLTLMRAEVSALDLVAGKEDGANELLAVGCSDNSIAVVDPRTSAILFKYAWFGHPVVAVALSTTCETVLALSSGGVVGSAPVPRLRGLLGNEALEAPPGKQEWEEADAQGWTMPAHQRFPTSTFCVLKNSDVVGAASSRLLTGGSNMCVRAWAGGAPASATASARAVEMRPASFRLLEWLSLLRIFVEFLQIIGFAFSIEVPWDASLVDFFDVFLLDVPVLDDFRVMSWVYVILIALFAAVSLAYPIVNALAEDNPKRRDLALAERSMWIVCYIVSTLLFFPITRGLLEAMRCGSTAESGQTVASCGSAAHVVAVIAAAGALLLLVLFAVRLRGLDGHAEYMVFSKRHPVFDWSADLPAQSQPHRMSQRSFAFERPFVLLQMVVLALVVHAADKPVPVASVMVVVALAGLVLAGRFPSFYAHRVNCLKFGLQCAVLVVNVLTLVLAIADRDIDVAESGWATVAAVAAAISGAYAFHVLVQHRARGFSITDAYDYLMTPPESEKRDMLVIARAAAPGRDWQGVRPADIEALLSDRSVLELLVQQHALAPLQRLIFARSAVVRRSALIALAYVLQKHRAAAEILSHSAAAIPVGMRLSLARDELSRAACCAALFALTRADQDVARFLRAREFATAVHIALGAAAAPLRLLIQSDSPAPSLSEDSANDAPGAPDASATSNDERTAQLLREADAVRSALLASVTAAAADKDTAFGSSPAVHAAASLLARLSEFESFHPVLDAQLDESMGDHRRSASVPLDTAVWNLIMAGEFSVDPYLFSCCTTILATRWKHRAAHDLHMDDVQCRAKAILACSRVSWKEMGLWIVHSPDSYTMENARLIIAQFGMSLGLSKLEFDNNNTCILGIDDKFSMHLTYEPNSKKIYLYSPLLDGLPKDDLAKMALYERLLEGALLGGQVAGGGVGLARAEELILMHATISVAESQITSMQVFAPLYVETVEKWRSICQSHVQDAPSSFTASNENAMAVAGSVVAAITASVAATSDPAGSAIPAGGIALSVANTVLASGQDVLAVMKQLSHPLRLLAAHSTDDDDADAALKLLWINDLYVQLAAIDLLGSAGRALLEKMRARSRHLYERIEWLLANGGSGAASGADGADKLVHARDIMLLDLVEKRLKGHLDGFAEFLLSDAMQRRFALCVASTQERRLGIAQLLLECHAEFFADEEKAMPWQWGPRLTRESVAALWEASTRGVRALLRGDADSVPGGPDMLNSLLRTMNAALTAISSYARSMPVRVKPEEIVTEVCSNALQLAVDVMTAAASASGSSLPQHLVSSVIYIAESFVRIVHVASEGVHPRDRRAQRDWSDPDDGQRVEGAALSAEEMRRAGAAASALGRKCPPLRAEALALALYLGDTSLLLDMVSEADSGLRGYAVQRLVRVLPVSRRLRDAVGQRNVLTALAAALLRESATSVRQAHVFLVGILVALVPPARDEPGIRELVTSILLDPSLQEALLFNLWPVIGEVDDPSGTGIAWISAAALSASAGADAVAATARSQAIALGPTCAPSYAASTAAFVAQRALPLLATSEALVAPLDPLWSNVAAAVFFLVLWDGQDARELAFALADAVERRSTAPAGRDNGVPDSVMHASAPEAAASFASVAALAIGALAALQREGTKRKYASSAAPDAAPLYDSAAHARAVALIDALPRSCAVVIASRPLSLALLRAAIGGPSSAAGRAWASAPDVRIPHEHRALLPAPDGRSVAAVRTRFSETAFFPQYKLRGRVRLEWTVHAGGLDRASEPSQDGRVRALLGVIQDAAAREPGLKNCGWATVESIWSGIGDPVGSISFDISRADLWVESVAQSYGTKPQLRAGDNSMLIAMEIDLDAGWLRVATNGEWLEPRRVGTPSWRSRGELCVIPAATCDPTACVELTGVFEGPSSADPPSKTPPPRNIFFVGAGLATLSSGAVGASACSTETTARSAAVSTTTALARAADRCAVPLSPLLALREYVVLSQGRRVLFDASSVRVVAAALVALRDVRAGLGANALSPVDPVAVLAAPSAVASEAAEAVFALDGCREGQDDGEDLRGEPVVGAMGDDVLARTRLRSNPHAPVLVELRAHRDDGRLALLVEGEECASLTLGAAWPHDTASLGAAFIVFPRRDAVPTTMAPVEVGDTDSALVSHGNGSEAAAGSARRASRPAEDPTVYHAAPPSQSRASTVRSASTAQIVTRAHRALSRERPGPQSRGSVLDVGPDADALAAVAASATRASLASDSHEPHGRSARMLSRERSFETHRLSQKLHSVASMHGIGDRSQAMHSAGAGGAEAAASAAGLDARAQSSWQESDAGSAKEKDRLLAERRAVPTSVKTRKKRSVSEAEREYEARKAGGRNRSASASSTDSADSAGRVEMLTPEPPLHGREGAAEERDAQQDALVEPETSADQDVAAHAMSSPESDDAEPARAVELGGLLGQEGSDVADDEGDSAQAAPDAASGVEDFVRNEAARKVMGANKEERQAAATALFDDLDFQLVTGHYMAERNLEEFGRELGMYGLELDDNNTCILGIDDAFSMHLTYEPNSASLYIYSPLLDGLPIADTRLMELYTTLLEASMLGGQLGGGGVGIAREEELILMHQRLTLERSGVRQLADYAPLYVSTVENWRARCCAIRDRPENVMMTKKVGVLPLSSAPMRSTAAAALRGEANVRSIDPSSTQDSFFFGIQWHDIPSTEHCMEIEVYERCGLQVSKPSQARAVIDKDAAEAHMLVLEIDMAHVGTPAPEDAETWSLIASELSTYAKCEAVFIVLILDSDPDAVSDADRAQIAQMLQHLKMLLSLTRRPAPPLVAESVLRSEALEKIPALVASIALQIAIAQAMSQQ